MSDDEVIERAAKAAMTIYHPHGSDDEWEETTEAYRQVWRDVARAILAAAHSAPPEVNHGPLPDGGFWAGFCERCDTLGCPGDCGE